MWLTILVYLIQWRDWLSQSADSWTPLAQNLQHNPIVMTMNVVSNILIAIGTLSIAGMFWYGTLRGKEINKELKIWFYLFAVDLILIASIFIFGIVVFWIPLYWVTGLLKLITGSMLLFTAFLLIKHIRFALQTPSRAEWEETLKAKIAAEERNRQLDDLLTLWEGAVENKITELHKEHNVLSKELQKGGVRPETDVEVKRRERRAKIIETLEAVKKDLKELSEDINPETVKQS